MSPENLSFVNPENAPEKLFKADQDDEFDEFDEFGLVCHVARFCLFELVSMFR